MPISTKENKKRNKELVAKRNKNPMKWTWGALGEFYGIHRSTAKSIFERYTAKYNV